MFPINSHADTTTGLVGWWKFEEGTGASAQDSSGRANMGTVVNSPSWVNGIRGKALSFNGATQCVSISQSSSLDITGNEISFGGWVYPTGTASYQMIVGKPVSAGERQYAMYLTSGNPNFLYVALSGVSPPTEVGTDFALSSPWGINTWNHIILTYESGTGVAIYLNGVSVYSSGWTGSITHRAANIYIGSEQCVRYNVVGSVDDVRIYNRALTAQDVYMLYLNSAQLRGGVLRNLNAKNN